jgi:flagellar FliL protein
MAEDHSHAGSAGASPRRGSGIMKLVKALAFVSVIVLLEVAAATAILPTPEETRRIGEELAHAPGASEGEEAEDHGESSDADHREEDHAGPPTREVSLGDYHVVAFNPSTGASMNIDFELFGVVLAEEEAEFAERFLLHEKRLNEQVTIAIRGMQASDFTDPGLGLIKRIILEKVNRALGKTIVREAIFSEFSFIER